MIDALFGSKTRVKLLHLFLNNSDRSFYVREITRLIDEQINSVRRELANMLEVGVIVSDSSDNKLYYSVNKNYSFYRPLQMIFADEDKTGMIPSVQQLPWQGELHKLAGLRIAIVAGVLVRGSASKVDILLVGSTPQLKADIVMKKIEKDEGRELNYAIMNYDDFYYRLSVRDRFVTDIINGRHIVLVDADKLLEKGAQNV